MTYQTKVTTFSKGSLNKKLKNIRVLGNTGESELIIMMMTIGATTTTTTTMTTATIIQRVEVILWSSCASKPSNLLIVKLRHKQTK